MPIDTDDKRRERYVDSAAMNVWVKAFTHSSIDYENNYESLETLGDKVLGGYFTNYCRNKFLVLGIDLSPDSYTNLNNYYQDRTRQGQMSIKYKFMEYLRIKESARGTPEGDVDAKIKGDTFEAFYGALFAIGNNILPGLGGVLVQNMVKFMYDKEDVKEQRKDAVSDISFMFNKFSDPGETETKNNYANQIKWASGPAIDESGREARDPGTGNITYYVILPLNVYLWLTGQGYEVDPEGKFKITYGSNKKGVILGEGKDRAKDKARKKAYQNARDVLDEVGFTTPVTVKIKSAEEFDVLDQNLVQRAYETAQNEGFGALIFGIPKDAPSALQLQGVKRDGRSVNLAVYEYQYGTDINEVRETLLRMYLE